MPADHSPQRNYGRWIFSLALVLRIACVVLFGDTANPQLWEYGMIAKHVAGGEGFSLSYTAAGTVPNADQTGTVTVPSAYMPPGYVWFLSLFLWLLGTQPTTFLLVLLVQSLAGAVSSWLVFHVAEKMFSTGAAAYAGILCACYPPYLYAGLDYGPTALYLVALGALLFLIIQTVEHPAPLRLAAAGLAAGLLSLIRAEGAFLALALCLWLAIRRTTSSAVIVLAVLIMVLTPWIVRNAVVFGKFVPLTTSSGFNFWRGHNPDATGTAREMSGSGIWGSDEIDARLAALAPSAQYEIQRDRIFLESALAHLRAHPVQEGLLAAKKIFFLWILDITHPRARSLPYALSYGVVFLCFVIGLSRCYEHPAVGLLFMFYSAMTVVAMLFFVVPRYQMIVTYGMIPVAGLGMSDFVHKFRNPVP